jgi:hypothetical protein
MTRRSRVRGLGDLDIAGIVRVHVAQRALAGELGRPVCGWFSGFAPREQRLCEPSPWHAGPHRIVDVPFPLAVDRT